MSRRPNWPSPRGSATLAAVARPGVRRLTVLLVGLALVAAACASDAPQDSLDPAGPDARTIDNLFGPVMVAALVVLVVVQALVVYAILKFRRRPDQAEGPEEVPAQVHGNTRLEIGWTILPALILAVVAIFTVPVIFDLDEEPKDALTVDVVGQKYWWAYRYPEQEHMDGPEFTTANELHIPAGQEVLLRLTSEDVIHSFWAPRLNGKRDVVPGREQTWKLEADEPGVYSGQCAEFCGTSHANMRLKVVAHDEQGWQDWLDDQQRPAEEPQSGLAAGTQPDPPVQPGLLRRLHVRPQPQRAGGLAAQPAAQGRFTDGDRPAQRVGDRPVVRLPQLARVSSGTERV
jgi:cytochrome c oxidase subunit 2